MDNAAVEVISSSVEKTLALGRAIGQALRGGEIIALIGELGTGKTHLIKGIALGLEVDDDQVNSPTFTLINEYEGRLPLIHIDAYRLDQADQLTQLGFDELCDGPAVVVVEWADLVWPLVGAYDPIVVRLAHCGPSERAVRMENLPAYLHRQTTFNGTGDS